MGVNKPVRKIAEVEGLEIFVTPLKAKTSKGKDRIWVSVRQKEPKAWRVSISHSYVNGFDIQLTKD